MYLYIYYEILIYRVLLAPFSFALPLIRQCFFLFLLFLVFYFFYTEIVLSVPFRKLRKAAAKRYSTTAFISTQETFQRGFNFVFRVIWLRDVGQCQINVETTLCMSTLKFTTLNNVTSKLSVSALILTTLEKVETMLLFSTSSFITLINVKTTF